MLPVLGEGAPALWRAARAAAGSWAWSDTILISEDPEDPGIRSEVAAEPALARRVLVLWRSALAPGGSGAALRRGHDGAGGRQRPDRPGRPPGRHPPSHGPGRPAPSPGGGDRPPHRGAGGARRRRCRRAAGERRPDAGPAAPRNGRVGAGVRRRAAVGDDAPPGRSARGPAAQPRPSGRGARGLPGAAPARRHHERPAAHPRARIVRRRRRLEDVVQHRLCGAACHGGRRAGRAPLSRRDATRPVPALAPASRSTCTAPRHSPPRAGRSPTRPPPLPTSRRARPR